MVRLVVGGGKQNAAVRLLTIGVLGVLAADSAYGWIQLNGSWKVGGPTDLGWVVFYVSWGAASLHPAMRQLTLRQPRPARQLSPVTLALLSTAALAAPLLCAWRDIAGVPTDAGILAGASAVVFVLVMFRLTGLARSQAVIAGREQTLRSISERLVTATDRSEVWDAAVAAVAGVSPKAALGCIVTDGSLQGERVLTASWPGLAGLAVDVRKMAGQRDRRSVLLSSGEALPSTSSTTVWTQLELATHDSGREHLLVGHDEPLPRDLRAILDSIAAQLTLALGRVELARVVFQSRNERRFQSMVQYSSDLITLVGVDLRISYESPAVASVLGRTPEQVIGRFVTDFVHPDDAPNLQAQFIKVLTGGLRAKSTFEYRAAHPNGEWRTIDTVMNNLLDEPDIGAIVLNGRDVTERRALERELNHQAFHDTLTGLANRALFLDRLAHAMDRGDRLADPVAVLFLDLDDFKTVNDSLGHPAGDRLLVAVADRIRLATRPGDTVARFGGDEFAILVESGSMPAAAEVLAERVTGALEPPFHVLSNEVSMRASIGIALGQRPRETPDDLLRDADLAMYLAKHNGKGRFEMYRPDMHTDAVHRLETAAGVRAGLEGHQFEVYYQPIVTAHTGRLIGAEALVRWNHPSRGVIAPDEFIPTAESTGLIVQLGRQVLRDAASQTQQWRENGVVDDDFYISVNLSARQLQEPDLVDQVSSALEESALPASALVLEMTESSLIEDLDRTLPRLHALKQLGLRLAVDDFGTGYSSLSYLADLPVSLVKIDKSFIDRITPDADSSAMIRGVVDLSRALGLSCIAEGVEMDNQLAVLDELGCDSAQGYLFARPTRPQDIAKTFMSLRGGRVIASMPAIAS
jgi:diguanylate cyclase (GGDEF)-like protein/PAS domain S-box-containing protein